MLNSPSRICFGIDVIGCKYKILNTNGIFEYYYFYVKKNQEKPLKPFQFHLVYLKR